MNRLVGISAVLALSLALCTACSAAPDASSSSAEKPDASASAELVASASAESTTPSAQAAPAASSEAAPAASSDAPSRTSSDAASSDAVSRASSDAASSDGGSSDRGSSDAASSNAASSGPVLSGPSGLAEMNVSMKYISLDEVQTIAESDDKTKVIIDLRKPADAQSAHIQGSIFAPMNKAVDNNNYADAIAELTGALHDAVGNEVGEGKDLILVCYQGKKYAQAATDILNALGADMDHVYTMEGGMKAWTEANKPTVSK